MNAYDVMREWDLESGRKARTPEELDAQVPATLAGEDYEQWKARLEVGDVKAIIHGLKSWGLSVGPLEPFEVDAAIETAERADQGTV